MEPPPVPASLTLATAIEYARRWHPRLQAAREQVRMARSEAVTAGLRPNPTFTFSGENFTQSGREREWFAFLSQTIETGGKRDRRRDVAEWAVRAAEAAAQEVERRVLTEVKLAYERALLERARWELARENLETFRQIARYNEVRVAEGYTAEGDLIKVRLEAQRAEFAMRRAQLEYEQAKIALLRAMGAAAFDSTVELREELVFEPVHLRAEDLERAALERPEAVRARAEVERAHAVWQLERARAKPDIVASFGYKRHGPENTLYGAVSLPLPIFNRNQGEIERAEAEWRWAEAEWRLVRGEILAEVTAARRAVEVAAEQVESLRRDFLQRADEARAVAVAAYREGAADLLVLLEAQRAHVAARELYLQALFEYRQALHNLERATGVERLPQGMRESPRVSP
jgi:cobalt-zinc-cadmium efflux system outer membrane protein